MIFFVWFLISTNSIWFSMIYCRPTFFRFFQFLLNFSHYSLLTNFTYIYIFLLRQNWSTISLFKLKSLSKLQLLICIRYTNSILLISFLFHFLFLFLSFCSLLSNIMIIIKLFLLIWINQKQFRTSIILKV